jgi:hypothetical protein
LGISDKEKSTVCGRTISCVGTFADEENDVIQLLDNEHSNSLLTAFFRLAQAKVIFSSG